MSDVDVIIPVYGDWRATLRCVNSVLGHPQATPFRVILIDDASPEPALRAALERVAARYPDAVRLLRNEENLGFVATANRGFREAEGHDVVLLNSDTQVAGDWLDRLVACAYSDPSIGTVTPMSNNAEICSFPRFCDSNRVPQGWSVADLDEVFRAVNRGRTVDLPTAVGFCMLVKRRCLSDVGLFDEERFGRGYGEENDLSMRAAQQGWRHVCALDTFVYHQRGASFGEGHKELEQRGVEAVTQRHPGYLPRVEAHIRTDPARPQRQAVALEMLRRDPRAKIVAVLHDLGGGTEQHVRELADELSDDAVFLTIKPAGQGWMKLETVRPASVLHLRFRPEGDADIVHEVLRTVGVDRIHFHHTMGIPAAVQRLPRDLGVDYDVTLHDYYLINGNPTLADAEGRYCWDEPDGDRRCAQARPLPRGVTLAQWREAQRALLAGAQRILVPSRATRALIRRAYPGLEPIVAPHPERIHDHPYPDPFVPAVNADEPLRIAVVGALNREKGADRLEACARVAHKQGRKLRWRLIGYAYRPLDGVSSTGPYDGEDLDAMIEAEAPHVIWFPAQWPETYSYTLSAALRSGRPIVAPDLGAFPERTLGRPLTWIEPWDLAPEQWLECLESVRTALLEAGSGTVYDWTQRAQPRDDDFQYRRDYLGFERAAAEPEREPPDLVPMLEKLRARHDALPAESWARALGRRAAALARHPALARVRGMLPVRLKSFVRGLLEGEPMS